MRRFGRKLKKTVLWISAVSLTLAVLLLAFSIVSYFVLLYPPVQERVLRFAEEKMSEFFMGEVTIRRIESNLISNMSVYDFRAVGTSGYGDSITASYATVNYWLPSIFLGRVRVRSAYANGVRGHIVMGPGNNIYVPFLPGLYYDSSYVRTSYFADDELPHVPESWPVKFHLGRAEVEGISGVYRDLSNNMVGEIVNAKASARFHALDSFSVDLRVPQASYKSPWWDGLIDTIGASGVVTWRNLKVHSMYLRGSGTTVTGSGFLSYFPGYPWDLRADFTTSIHPLPVLYSHVDGVGKDGTLTGSAFFGGTLYQPLYSARVKGRGMKFRGYDINALNVDAIYGSDEYARAHVRGECEFGQFEIGASLLMKDLMTAPDFGDYSLTASLTGLDGGRIADELKLKMPVRVEGANVRLKAGGKGIAMPSTINVSAKFDGEDIVNGPLDIDADIAGGQWSLTGLWGVNRIDGRGRVDLLKGTLRGTVDANVPDPSSVSRTFTGERVTGRINASADILGRVDNLSVSASVRGDKVAWRGMQADSLDVIMTVADGAPRLPMANAKLSGRIDSVALYFGHDSVDGYVEAVLKTTGGLENPRINAQVKGRQMIYKQYGLDEFSGTLAFANDTLYWSDSRLREGNTHVHTGGRVKLGADTELAAGADVYLERHGAKTSAGRLSIRGSVRGDSLFGANCRIASMPLEALEPWIPKEHGLGGVLSLTGSVSGAVANPRARVDLQLTDPVYNKNRAYTIVGNAILADSLVHAAALLRPNRNSDVIEITGTLPFLPASGWKLDETGKRAASVKASSSKFDIGAVTGFLEPDVRLAGKASFEAGITNTGNGWDLGGKLIMPDGAVRCSLPQLIDVKNVTLRASVSGTLEKPDITYTLTSGVAEMAPLRVEDCIVRGRAGLDTFFIDEARFTFRDFSRLDMSGMALLGGGIDSIMHNRNFYMRYTLRNFPVTMFAPILPEYNFRKGVFNGSGVVYGMNGRPMVGGMMYLSRLELTLPDITPPIGPASAAFRLAGDTIEVSSADVKWGRGVISAKGRLLWDMEKVYNMNLNLKAAGLFFELPEVIQVGVENADLRVFDRNGNINMQGKVVLAPTNYVRDISAVSVFNQIQTGSVRRDPDPFLQSVRLRIDLDLANNMNVNVNLGSVSMDGRLTVAGTAAEPGVVGTVRVTGGHVNYLDRKFDIIEGTLLNPYLTAINPNLNIIARTDVPVSTPSSRIETYTITLSLLGTLENPVVRFTSEPALSKLDILSVLTFGERMGGMGSDINDRLMNIAAQQVLGLGARRLERFLNVDRVSVSGDVTGSGATIGITKRFTSRLNLTYETNMGNFSDRKVTAQYRLLPNLFLEGQTTGEGDNALDLIFRYSK